MLTQEDKQWIADQVSSQIVASEERMMARMEQIETSLLTEFHKWTSPVEMRPRSHAAAIKALDTEM